jgi:hypothetical protein
MLTALVVCRDMEHVVMDLECVVFEIKWLFLIRGHKNRLLFMQAPSVETNTLPNDDNAVYRMLPCTLSFHVFFSVVFPLLPRPMPSRRSVLPYI